MELAVIGHRLCEPLTGVGRYLEALLYQWSRVETPFRRIIVYCPGEPNIAPDAIGPPVELRVVSSRLYSLLSGISVLAIPRWSGYSDPRLGCKVFVFLSRSMLRSLPFGSLNAARSPRSSSLEGFSPTRLRVVPSSATQRLFSVAAVARYPPGTGSAQIRPSISANSLRLRCPSANSSQ